MHVDYITQIDISVVCHIIRANVISQTRIRIIAFHILDVWH